MFKTQSCVVLSPPRTGSNFLTNFIAKKFTLVRDKENQLTEVVEGYFPN